MHSARTAGLSPGCVALAEYRLDELAEISGVSARNIRAYRERGLLDPPRRVGRSAFYDDYHLSQLRTINQLLRRGFNSAHIAEFFASMRQGTDLADILGIQRAVLGPEQGPAAPEERPSRAQATEPPPAVDIDPESDEARRLVEYGLAELADAKLTMVDPGIGAIVARAPNQLLYVRALLRIHEATREAIDGLAAGFVPALEEFVAARFGNGISPNRGDRRVEPDRPGLSRPVEQRGLRPPGRALHEQMMTTGSDYTASVLLGGSREAKTSRASGPRKPS